MDRKTNSLLSKFNSRSLLLFVVILIAFPKQVGISQSGEEINSVASSFYIVDDEADFPPVNPLGIKQDAAGNVHLWYFFIEPGSFDGDQDISVYYNILFTNGTNFLTQLLRESLLLTKFSFFQRLNFVETSDGKVYSIFVHTTLFGESIKQFGWSPEDGFFTEKLDFPSFLSLKGDIRGPIQNRDITEFYVTSSNSNGNKRLIQLRFSEGDYLGTNVIVFPTIVNPELETSISMFDIFDIAYVNGSRFLLGSVPRSPDRMDLVIVEDHLNGNQTVFVQLDSINVSPIFPGLQFIAGILVDLLLPSLVSTENGRLYSFLFSFSETVQLNQLVRWTPNGKTNVFQEFVENPFLISFFPVIEAVGNEVRIAALGFQIAQETFIVSVDTFRYNSETGEFSKKKISDNNFSFGIFLFAVDLESDYNLGFAGTVATPDYVKDEYNIVNDTVGSIFVFSEGVLPDILPNFLDVHVAEISLEDEEVINYRLIFIVSVISLLALTVLSIWYRSKALKLPSIIKEAKPDEEHHKKTVLERISSMVTSHLIYGKANRQRFQISIFVLIIPTLILMTVFTGIISH
ncbi:MAG: hypothetical protein IH840_10445 [Candidatus Heimdallarchaeota archaeon]|nr:hypothetical protein [Candidatus Heimdallarchaeota archaeon]